MSPLSLKPDCIFKRYNTYYFHFQKKYYPCATVSPSAIENSFLTGPQEYLRIFWGSTEKGSSTSQKAFAQGSFFITVDLDHGKKTE